VVSIFDFITMKDTKYHEGSNAKTPPPTCVTVSLSMATRPQNPPPEPSPGPLYCPNCAQEVKEPLTCGDCSAVICRRCGTPLENPDELGIG
jgi:hypothetical protein